MKTIFQTIRLLLLKMRLIINKVNVAEGTCAGPFHLLHSPTHTVLQPIFHTFFIISSLFYERKHVTLCAAATVLLHTVGLFPVDWAPIAFQSTVYTEFEFELAFN